MSARQPGGGLEGWRRERRAQQRRQRRRRMIALAALAAVVVAVVAVVAIAGGGGGGGGKATAGAGGGASGHARGHTQSRARGRTQGGAGSGSGGSHTYPAPLAKAGAVPAGANVAVPILMYHVINPPPPGAPFPGLYVQREEFAEQVKALYNAGFVAVTLNQLWSHWRHGTPLPPGRPVVLSFDNGYQSQYTNALPILRALHWRAVENIQLSGLPPSQGGLSEAQVRGLIKAGWELDTQGYSHAELIVLSPAELRFQVAATRRTLQRRYHQPVRWFCYPSGHYNAAVVAAVKKAGYIGSTTVVPGWARPAYDPYRMPRLRVLRGTTGSQLIALIEATQSNPEPPAAYE